MRENNGKNSDNKFVWIVVAVMSVICVLVGVLSSILTVRFMKKGENPPAINGEPSQQVSTVVALRKSTVVEIVCGPLHGSGVVMKFENSKVYVLTNAHMLGSVVTPAVRFYGEDEYFDAETVGYNSFYDVAVLTVAHEPKYTVYDLDGSEFFSPSREFNEGDYTVALGNAMGMGISAYDGIIARKSDILQYGDKLVPVTRTTAAINAGMSGGALYDMEGYFIGLGTYRMSTTDDSAGSHNPANDVEDTGFVVPVSIVYPIYKQILAYGDGGETGVLNMRYYAATTSVSGGINAIDLGFTCEFRGGALTVATVDQNGGGDIAVGDVITLIGSSAVKNDFCAVVGELLKYRRTAYTGTTLKLTLLRKGATIVKTYDGIFKNVE